MGMLYFKDYSGDSIRIFIFCHPRSHAVGDDLKESSLSPDILEKSFDLALVVETDVVRRRHTRQSGHGHDIATDRDDELGSR